MIILIIIVLILLVVMIWLLKQLSDDLWAFQCYSDEQYAEILDKFDDLSSLENKIYETIIKSLEQEDKIYKTIQEWSEKK